MMGNKKRFLSLMLSLSLIIGSFGSIGAVSFAEEVLAEDLFISEYVEGSSSNKALEIYNGTGATVDLKNYKIRMYTNGDQTKFSELELNGELANESVLLIFNSKASPELMAKGGENPITSNVCNFNGDDPIYLYKGEEIIDIIGPMGDVDYAVDVTLLRIPGTIKGSLDQTDPKTNSNWIVKEKDYFDDFGSYTFDAFPILPSIETGKSVFGGTELELSNTASGGKVEYSIKTDGDYSEYVEYTGPISINSSMSIKVKYTSDSGKTKEEIYSYTVVSEASTVAYAREQGIKSGKLSDSYVMIKGVITSTSFYSSKLNYYAIQDETSGIALNFEGTMNYKPGDVVEAIGKVGEAYNQPYIKVESEKDMRSSGTAAYEPVTIDLANTTDLDATLDANEGRYVRIENVDLYFKDDNGKKYFDYSIKDGPATVIVKASNNQWLKEDTGYKSIEGSLFYSYGTYKIFATVEGSVILKNEVVYAPKPSVEAGAVPKGTSIILSSATEGAKVYYTTDGSEPTSESALFDPNNPIVIDKDITVKAIALKEGAQDSTVTTMVFVIDEIVDANSISKIQGLSIRSPFDQKTVEGVEGIVTAKINYQFDGGNKNPEPPIVGFYMQDPVGDGNPNTSDAILVLSKSTVNIGDKVKVTGMVEEFLKKQDFYAYSQDNQLTVTAINTSSGNVEIVSSNNELPEAMSLGKNGRVVPHDLICSDNFSEYDPSKYALDFYESLESMRVKLDNPLVVAAIHNRTLSVVGDDGEIAKADGDLTKYSGVILGETDLNTEILQLNDALGFLKGAEALNPGAKSDNPVLGIMDYEWGAYQIYVSETLPQFSTPEVAKDSLSLELSEDKLTIASYNIYNHGGDASEDKKNGIAGNIVNDMKSPDIIGLIEVQDNNGTTNDSVVDADKTYNELIEAIVKAGGPIYKWTDIPPVDDKEGGAGGGNIRVGYLYNPTRVTLKDGIKGTSTQSIAVSESGELSLNPGRISADAEAFEDTRKSLVAEFEFRGESVVVIANHFSSKGGDSATFGNVQPVVKGSEVNRVKQAKLINDFVKELVSKKPGAKVVALGDMNDFQFSSTLKTLEGDVLKNMINTLPEVEQYSYNYSGNAQILDNILVSNNIVGDTEIDIININSIQYDKSKTRHSDHDPVVVALKNIGSKDAVVNPQFSKSGLVEKGTSVEISSKTEESKIYYSIDKPLDLNNLENNTLYTSPIVIDKDMSISAVAVKGDKKSSVVSYQYKIIGEVILTSIADARNLTKGTEVVMDMTVTSPLKGLGGKSVFLSDESGYTYIHTGSFSSDIAPGTKVRITGMTDEYKGMFQIKPSKTQAIGTGVVPTALLVKDIKMIGESMESRELLVKGVTIDAISTDKYENTFITFSQGENKLSAKIDSRSGEKYDSAIKVLKIGDKVDVKGFVYQTDSEYSLRVMSLANIIINPIEIPEEIALTDLKVKDLSDKDVSVVAENGFVQLEVKTTNTTANKDVQGVVIIKIQKDDKPYRIGIVKNAKSDGGIYSLGFDTSGLEVGKYEVKAYYWDGLDTMKPIGNSKETSFEIK